MVSEAALSQCGGSSHNDELCVCGSCRLLGDIPGNKGKHRGNRVAELKRSQSIVIKVGFEGKEY